MAVPEETITQLVAVLEDEVQAHENLVETAQRLNDAIKRKDVKDVQAQTQRYDSFIGRVEELEEQRLALCDAYAQASTGDRRHMTLAAIIASLSDETLRGRVSALRASIREKIMTLSRLNTANQILLEASLAGIAKSFEIMLRSREKFQGYGNGGVPTPRTTTRNILNKIA